MLLVLTEPAHHDLGDIIDYIEHENPPAAEKVYRAIVAAAGRLIDFPEIGRPGRLPDTREIQVSSLPYMIVYRVEMERVTILAVFHSSRDLPRALAERRRQTKR